MGLFRSIGARKDATRGTAAIEVRKGLAQLFTGAGVLPRAPSPLVTGTAGWAYNAGAAGFVSTRGASDGVHLFGNDGTVTIGTTGVGSTVPVAPGSGLQRIDIAWVLHPSASENSDTISEPSFGVTSGTAASTASPPTIPTGALELARNLMTSTATSTASTGNSITQTALYAVAAGAPISVYSQAQRDALVAYNGQRVVRLDVTGRPLDIYNGSAWVLGDTGWVAPALQNGWVNFVGAYRGVFYRRMNGIVYVRGLIKNGTVAAGTILFNLPAGFRPSTYDIYTVWCNGSAKPLELGPSGNVVVGDTAVSAFSTSLSFEFPAEA